MLHTIVPLDVIFASEPPETEEETVGAARLVWRKDGGSRVLCRVISSDLKDYLKYNI